MRVQAGEWHWNKPSEADSNCHVRCQPCRGPRKDRPTKRITRNSWHVVVILVSPGYLQAARHEELTHRGRPAVFFSTLLHDPAFRMKLCQALGAKNFTYDNQFIAFALFASVLPPPMFAVSLQVKFPAHTSSNIPISRSSLRRPGSTFWTLACRESPLPIPISIQLSCYSVFPLCNDEKFAMMLQCYAELGLINASILHLGDGSIWCTCHWWKPKKHRHVSFLGKRI